MERRVQTVGTCAKDGFYFFVAFAYEHRYARFYDTGFFRGYQRTRRAEYGRVVQRYIGYYAQKRCNDIGRVEPSSQSGFYDGHIDIFTAEIIESHAGASTPTSTAEVVSSLMSWLFALK